MAYKNVRRVIVAGFETIVNSVDTIIHLTEQTAGSSTADAMQKSSGVYQVTAGKTFQMLGCRIWTDATGGGTVTIYQADTEDATTSSKVVVDVPLVPSTHGAEQYIHTVTIASGKFITIVPSTTTVLHFEIIGFERD